MTEAIAPGFWSGRRVFLTGHTGFKGAWLAWWLREMGASVIGYALPPSYPRGAYELSRLHNHITDIHADINDAAQLSQAMRDADPHIVFHLAAQPLVRESYRKPVETFRTNVMGTANLLAGLESCRSLKAAVIVTTDKCYRNRELSRGYREDDPLGGHDPYSSSKACAEILCESWRQSYLRADGAAGLATARAGNVFGGGDWSADRLVPDVLRCFESGTSPSLRHPEAIRPWQHVLDPLAGYLLLAQKLTEDAPRYAGSWNFGPAPGDAVTVGSFVERLLARLGTEADWIYDRVDELAETARLVLDSSKADQLLGWSPRISLDDGLELTLAWHRGEAEQADLGALMSHQIAEMMKLGDQGASS